MEKDQDQDVVEIVGINSLVQTDHLLQKIEASVDCTRLYETVEPLYCEDNVRPSADPVVLFKNGAEPAFVRAAVTAAGGREDTGQHLLRLVSGVQPAGENTTFFHNEL